MTLDAGWKARSNGTHFLNAAPIGATATIGATGLGRSGTTMISRIMDSLGVDMGKNLTPRSHEDKYIRSLAKSRDLPGFERYCRTRDLEAQVWGFKVPALRSDMADFTSVMRNPRIIVTFRDILAISLRNYLALKVDVTEGLMRCIDGYKAMLQNVFNLSCPVLLVSYEKALLNPIEAVKTVAAFCGVAVSATQAAAIAETSIMNGDPRYIGA